MFFVSDLGGDYLYVLNLQQAIIPVDSTEAFVEGLDCAEVRERLENRK